MIKLEKIRKLEKALNERKLATGETTKSFFDSADEIFCAVGELLSQSAESAPSDSAAHHYLKAYNQATESFRTIIIPRIQRVPNNYLSKTDFVIAQSGIVHEMIGLEMVINEGGIYVPEHTKKQMNGEAAAKNENEKKAADAKNEAERKEAEAKQKKKEKLETSVNSVKEIIQGILDYLNEAGEKEAPAVDPNAGRWERFKGWVRGGAKSIGEALVPDEVVLLAKTLFEVIDEIIKIMM